MFFCFFFSFCISASTRHHSKSRLIIGNVRVYRFLLLHRYIVSSKSTTLVNTRLNLAIVDLTNKQRSINKRVAFAGVLQRNIYFELSTAIFTIITRIARSTVESPFRLQNEAANLNIKF